MLAYALSRMPATYAAVSAVLGELSERGRLSLRRRRVLGCRGGAGNGRPGRRQRRFRGSRRLLVDHNRAFLSRGRDAGGGAHQPAGRRCSWVNSGGSSSDGRSDLVTCAYALTELPMASCWRRRNGCGATATACWCLSSRGGRVTTQRLTGGARRG